jgi:hypothetical protein
MECGSILEATLYSYRKRIELVCINMVQRLIWWWPDPGEKVLSMSKETKVIKGFEHIGEDHKCNVCSCDFTEDEGGTIGYFGMLPVAFCPTCYSSMVDMVSQDLSIEEAE